MKISTLCLKHDESILRSLWRSAAAHHPVRSLFCEEDSLRPDRDHTTAGTRPRLTLESKKRKINQTVIVSQRVLPCTCSSETEHRRAAAHNKSVAALKGGSRILDSTIKVMRSLVRTTAQFEMKKPTTTVTVLAPTCQAFGREHLLPLFLICDRHLDKRRNAFRQGAKLEVLSKVAPFQPAGLLPFSCLPYFTTWPGTSEKKKNKNFFNSNVSL